MIIRKKIKISELFEHFDNIKEEDIAKLPEGLIKVKTEEGFQNIDFLYKTNKRDLMSLTLQNGLHIDAVPDHRVKTKEGWKFLRDLNEKDEVLTEKGFSNINIIKDVDYKENCYDLQVDNTHSFFGNGILNHNTEIFISLCKLTNKKTLILFARIALAQQTLTRMKKAGLDAGIVQGNKIDDKHQIVMATVQSGHKLNKLEDYEMVIVDECFPSGTYVHTDSGIMNIKNIVENKLTPKVLSYNEENNIFEYRNVYDWYKKSTEELYEISIDNKISKIKATPNHPFYLEDFSTKRADELQVGDKIISTISTKVNNGRCRSLTRDRKSALLGVALGGGCLYETKNKARIRLTHGEKQLEYLQDTIKLLNIFTDKLHKVPSGYNSNKNVFQIISQSSIEIRELCDKLYINRTKTIYNVFDDLDEIALAFWIMDDGHIDFYYNKDGTQKFYYGIATCCFTEQEHDFMIKKFKERFDLDCIKKFDKRTKVWSIHFNNENSEKLAKMIAPYVLKSMEYKLPDKLKSVEKYQYESERNFSVSVIKSINKLEIHKEVYNISVENNHNYVINSGYLVKNCHRASGDQYRELMRKSRARYRFGFSATPFVKDQYKAALVRMWIGPLIYEVDPKKLLQEKRIATPTIRMIPISDPQNISQCKWPRIEKVGIVENSYRNRIVVNLAKMLKGQTLILVKLLDHGDYLSENIPNSVWLSGKNKDKERDDIIKRFDAGEDFVLIASTIFDEGIDIKTVKHVILCGGGASYVKILQRIGRGMRVTDTKTTVDVYDFYDTTNDILEKHAKERIKTYKKEGYDDIRMVDETLIKKLGKLQ